MSASDSVVIIASLGSSLFAAITAACVALRIHAQRLRHERGQADIAELRRVLDAGAELIVQVDPTARAMDDTPVGPQREAISLSRELVAYEQRLLVWVDSEDDLLQGWEDIVDAYSAIEGGSDVETIFAGGQLD